MDARRTVIAILALALALCPAPACLAVVVCPTGTTLQGVDVTRYQGTADWSQVAASGVAFAFARVSDGLSADANFAGNYAGIKAAGMIRGAYQVLRPGQDALAQADLLVSSIGVVDPGDLPPALSVEITDGLSPSVIGSAVADWAAAVQEATGRTPLVLTNAIFWNGNVSYPGAEQYPLWVAHWSVACPNTPSIWSGWVFWQYTASGSVPGIAGAVDKDVFNGPLSDLQALAGMAPVDVPSPQMTPLRLYPNQPNPFNPRTTIRFDLPEPGSVRLAVYDIAGRLLKVLVGGEMAAGSHEAVWDGRDAAGGAMASGSYFARLEAGGRLETVRMSLVR